MHEYPQAIEILFKELSFAVMGACFEVFNEKGAGFVEPVYQECLQLELREREIRYQAQACLTIFYKTHLLTQRYIPDFLIDEKIILEIKAVKSLTDDHRAQVLNYLKATGLRLGLLVNFGHSGALQWERLVL